MYVLSDYLKVTMMLQKSFATIDGNKTVAKVADQLKEVVAIYPVTLSSRSSTSQHYCNEPLGCLEYLQQA